MDSLTKALTLVENGYWVFPVILTKDGKKVPAIRGSNGGSAHLDATNDVEQVAQWFQNEYPHAVPGVHAGRSKRVLLDIDVKESGDGFQSIEDDWLPAPEGFTYTSVNGKGSHFIYRAPENVVLNGQANYRGLVNVDRRAGSSWWLYAGDTVDTLEELTPAPEWLCDPAVTRTGQSFAGGLGEWFDSLLEGPPTRLVRDALDRLENVTDLSHSEMVEAQYNAVRLGSEGSVGVPELLDRIRTIWLARPEQNHSTPRSDWENKYSEALESAVSKYGAPTEEMADLPDYDLNALPGVNTALLVGEPKDKQHFSSVLNHLIQSGLPDNRIAATLWGAPTTSHWAREWGIEFVYERITKAHTTPEPERENPALERAETTTHVSLLTDKERDHNARRPTFVHRYMELAERTGFANPVYTHSAAWSVAGMAFAFRGFVPASKTAKMGTNLWLVDLGPSGTGKSSAMDFEQNVLDLLFKDDEDDSEFYRIGGSPSPQGIMKTLLHRDRKPTLIHIDEASGFFKDIRDNKYMSTLNDMMSKWYSGRVEPTSNLSWKELRGKSALTSFNMHLYATPSKLTGLLEEDMIETGFLARVLWSFAPPRPDDVEIDYLSESAEVQSYEDIAPEVEELAIDLVHAARMIGPTPKPVTLLPEAKTRMTKAIKAMESAIKGHESETLLEAPLVRVIEALRKCAMICALYRGDTKVNRDDALHAIEAVEIWFNNLFEVVSLISAGEFQRNCSDIESWIRARGGVQTETRILDNFRNRIKRDPRELDAMLRFLVDSGRLNKDEEGGRVCKYRVNGG